MAEPSRTGAIPTVSRVFADGTLVELVYDPATVATALAIRHPGGTSESITTFDAPDGGRLVPYAATNNLIQTGCVLLPSEVRDFGDVGDLVRDIQAYLHRYVDLSPLFEEIAAYYALLTWVYDAFSEVPFLRFRGDYGTGKTRALLALGSVCYKPFFASGASTVSPIFHILDAFQGTLILDEADFRFSDATAELTKILNNGNMRGLPVLRTMTNRHKELNPTAFRVFGPKIVGMRGSFTDPALESRFITEDTGARPLRADISIALPASLHTDARELRNRLLAWRFHAWGTVGADSTRLIPGASPRLNQTALALLSLVDDVDLRQRIAARLLGEEDEARAARQASLEAVMLGVLLGRFSKGAKAIPLSELAQLFHQETAEQFAEPPSNKWVGWFLRTRLHLATMKSRGIYVVPETERAKIMVLAGRIGLSVDQERAA